MKFAIGIPLLNNASNVKNLIFSIRATTSETPPIFVLDNGSTEPGVTDEVAAFCTMAGVTLIREATNTGVPGAWNRLAVRSDADVVILLNDDLRASTRGWLESVKSVFELNDNVGIVYWGQKLVSPATGVVARYTSDSLHFKSGCTHPLVRANFSGAFFAIRRRLWSDVRQPDGSVGFWDDLLSYGEEFDTSAECHKRKLLIVQLPFFWEHLHSQTFKASPTLRLRTSGPSAYLDDAEYLEFCHRFPQLGGIRIKGRKERLAIAVGLARQRPPEYPRLPYSLAMVFKKWCDEKILGIPAHQLFEEMMRNGAPRAIQAAAERGDVVRSPLRYRDLDGIERTASWDDLTSDPTPNLC